MVRVKMKLGKKESGRKLTAILVAMKKSDKRKAKQRKVHTYIPVVSATDFFVLPNKEEDTSMKSAVEDASLGKFILNILMLL